MREVNFEIILGENNVVLARVELTKTFAAEASAFETRSHDRVARSRADRCKDQHQPSNLRRDK